MFLFRSFHLALCTVSGLALLIGCSGTGDPPIDKARAKPTSAPLADSSPREEDNLAGADEARDDQPAADKIEEAETKPSPSNGPDPEAVGSTAVSVEQAVEQQVERTTERILLLAPGGPLVVEFALAVEGQTLESAIAPVVQRALDVGDTDGDGVARWDEVLEHPRFRYGGFGNMRATEAAQRRQIKQVYDVDRDGVMNREEVFRFITNDQGGGRTFSLDVDRYDHGYSVERSPLRMLLDRDSDLQLSAEEIASAVDWLRYRDADDDGVMTPSDFAPPSMTPDRAPSRRRSGPRSAHALGESANWTRIANDLNETYGFGFSIEPDAFPLLPTLFGQLDEDGDQLLSTAELKAFLDCEAHICITVEFGGDEGVKSEISVMAPELTAFAVSRGQNSKSILLRLPGGDLTIEVPTRPATGGPPARAEQLVAMYDGDGNGYLDAEEFMGDQNQLMVPLAAVDGDGDEKAYPQEIIQFLADQQAARQSRVQAAIRRFEDPLFATLDADHDNRLSERELIGLSGRLLSLDRDEDGQVSTAEISDSIRLVIARGDVVGQAAGETSNIATPTRDATAPRWFQSMDTNQDGEVSAAEFLGDASIFHELDQSGDGFIDAGESAAGHEDASKQSD